MHGPTRQLVYWTPRILCIAFAIFLGIFALDVFTERQEFPQRMLALAMHLIPSVVVLVALAIVWRREWIAAMVFPLLAVYHVVTLRGLDWSGYAVIDGPLVMLAVLFLFSWRQRRAVRAPGKA